MTTADTRPAAGAWPLENAVFSAALLAHRLPWTDAPARALGLHALTREGAVRHLLAHLHRTRSGRPVRLSTPFGSFLVPLTRADTAGLLAAAGRKGALGPAAGFTAGGRRHGLHPHTPLPPEAVPPSDGLAARIAEDLDGVVAARRGDGTLDPERWRSAMLRLARRVVVGADADRDSLLSEVLTATAAAAGSRTYESRNAALHRRLAPYLAADPDPDTPAGRLAAAGHDPDEAVPALAHTLAVVSEAAVTTALQALALYAAGPDAADPGAARPDAAHPDVADAAAAAVRRALDHYPPVAAAVHPVRAAFTWEGLAVAEGTEILAAPARLNAPDPADDGRQEAGGPADGQPSPLCGAPAGCTAGGFAALVAGEIVRGIRAVAHPVLISPQLTPDRLPYELAPDTVLVALTPADPTGRTGAAPSDGRVAVGTSAAVPRSAHGYSPASYGALARTSADRLDRQAESLAACAAHTGWNGGEAGERFRLVLLAHADRCAKAAADVRGAARALAD
ncbi:hypothetical protein [Streptomyces sp. NPDC089799]|uniref:hypothetical protein n=1 Tax=Streptomyces sp. NPDC089799 TaxID=3155066 RepID=UPI00343B361B